MTGRPDAIRTSVDSISYSLGQDIQSTTGTLADVLRNVPSVDVDAQGNVSLRGDPGVVILVDGRPSGMLSGEGRAQALLQLPADQYSRVEVMTNPSAAYRPDGAGGVINLITKPVVVRRGTTTTGSMRANVGDDGRKAAGLTVSRVWNGLTLSGDLSVRHDIIPQNIERVRESLDPVSGQFLASRQSQDIELDSESYFGRASAEYSLSAKTVLTGELRTNIFDNRGPALERFIGAVSGSGASNGYRRVSEGGTSATHSGATARLVHRFDDRDHEWSTSLRIDQGRNRFEQSAATSFSPPPSADAYETVDNRSQLTLVALNNAYIRPMPDDGKLRAGFEYESRETEQDNRVSRGPDPDALVPDVRVTNRFLADQVVHALYGTYERPFGKLTSQVGLRLEYAEVRLDQTTTGARASQDYLRAYPTLHLGYDLTDEQILRASYSRRIQRPQPAELNPFPIYQDARTYRAGNPDLRPQETDSFELTWQRRVSQTFQQAALYYRDTRGAFTSVTTPLPDGVFVTRPENLGARRDFGLELVASGPLPAGLHYNASLTLARQEIDASGVSGGADRSGSSLAGRMNLNWQPTPDDFLQFAGTWQGDALQAQGVRKGSGSFNLGYRRRLSDALAFQATVRDVFDQFTDVATYETPQFRERTERRGEGRAWHIGLTYLFGQGARRQEPQFDYSGPPGGG